MALNFPASPTANQTHTDASTGLIYQWNDTYGVWRILANTSPVYDYANTRVASVTSNSTSRIWANTVITGSSSKDVFLDLATSGVTPSNYGSANTIPVISVDPYGRVTNASVVSVQGMDYTYANSIGATSNTWANTRLSNVIATAGRTAVSWTTTGGYINATIDLATTTVTPSTYGGATQIPVFVVDAYGRLTSAANVAVQGMDYAYANSIGASSNAWTNSVNSFINSTYVKLTAPNQTITGDLSIAGNLSLLGSSTVISSNTLSVGDSLIYLAANNYSGTDILDIGFIANYGNTTGANVHTGLIRNATDKKYYLFNGYDQEPANNTFVPSTNNMVNAVLVSDIETSNLTLGGANAIQWIGSAFSKANNALANTSGVTFAGDLYFPTGKIGIGTNSTSANLGVYGTALFTSTALNAGLGKISLGIGGNNNFPIFEINNSADSNAFRVLNVGDWRIGSVDNYAVSLITNNTQRVYIDTNGNVGIGNTNPFANFEVNGWQQLNGGGTQLRLFPSGDTTYIGTATSHKLNFRTGSADRITIDTVGNVGIGNTSPVTKLHVKGSVNGDEDVLTLEGSQTGTGLTGIIFKNAGGPAHSGAIRCGPTVQDPSGGRSLTFWGDVSGTLTERMRLDANGNFGLGVTSPKDNTKPVRFALSLTSNTVSSGIFIADNFAFASKATGGSHFSSAISSSTNFPGWSNYFAYTDRYRSGNIGDGSGFNYYSISNPRTAGINQIGTYYSSIRSVQSSVSSVYGFVNLTYLQNTAPSTGIITNAYGFHSKIQSAVGPTSTGSQYDFYADTYDNSDSNPSSIITNRYGVYLAYSNAYTTNAWGIYQVDANVKSYFAGNVGIGNTSPVAKLHITDTTGTASTVLARFEGASGRFIRIIDNDGSGGAGVQTTRVYGDSGASGTLRLFNTYGNSNRSEINIDTNYVAINTSSASTSTERMRIDNGGNVAIGLTSTTFKLQVNGSFAANTKSFVIDHPTKPGMKLRHGSLEGPENGVYVRGKIEGTVIDLPDYWTGLVDEDSITVQLTAIGRSQSPYVVEVSNNKVFIDTENHTLPYCYYHIYGERKDVDKLVVEFDA